MVKRLAVSCVLSVATLAPVHSVSAQSVPAHSVPPRTYERPRMMPAPAPRPVPLPTVFDDSEFRPKSVPIESKPTHTAASGDDDEVGQGPVLLGVAALAFGLAVIGVVAFLRLREAIDNPSFTKLAGLALVLSVGMSLIVVGYSQQQITPMMGLLGTVAGYLLGKSDDAAAARAKAPG